MIICTGNIVHVQSGVVLHQVNCRNSFGYGVAEQIARTWPVVKERYHAYCESVRDPQKLFGACLPVSVSPYLTVVNAFSQLNYGNPRRTGLVYTDVNALLNCIDKTLAHYPGETPVYIPWGIGCGFGGYDWENLLPELEHRYAGIDRLLCVKLPSAR